MERSTTISESVLNEAEFPFFKQYSLVGKKKKDFRFFCQAARLITSGKHRTKEGVSKLREIQSKMNLRRRLKLESARMRENRVSSGSK